MTKDSDGSKEPTKGSNSSCSRVPTLNLSQIKDIADNGDDSEAPNNDNNQPRMCNTYGYFLKETLKKDNSRFWTLGDAFLVKGYDKIKLSGSLEQYPTPKPGDVVRIHRLCFDKRFKCAYIPNGRNVLVWDSFRYKPNVVHTSNKPTISETDLEERRKLEVLYSNMITPINNLMDNNLIESNQKFFTIAGRVEKKELDKYQNLLIHFNDGTAKGRIRLFPKGTKPNETNDHFELGLTLKDGDYFVASNTKLNNKDLLHFDLSANFEYGRGLRLVQDSSILGVKLTETLPKSTSPVGEPQPELIASQAQRSQPVLEPTTSSETPRSAPRRSPRLNPDLSTNVTTVSPSKLFKSSHQQVASTSPISPPKPLSQDVAPGFRSGDSNNNIACSDSSDGFFDRPDPILKYTKISDITKKPDGKYDFYDIAGQVRGKPQESESFKNWLFQLYDGSKFDFGDFNLDQIKEPIEDCITVIVYSTQYPHDDDVHLRKAKSLNDGDLVLIRNVRAIWRLGKLRLELHPNTNHNKGITLIEKDSAFGKYLTNIVAFRLDIEELNELGRGHTQETVTSANTSVLDTSVNEIENND